MNTEIKYLQQMYISLGGNLADLPDNLLSTIYEAIIEKCGGAVDNLPDHLETTYLKYIAECMRAGGENGAPKDYHVVKMIVDCSTAARRFFNGASLTDISDFVRYDTFENATQTDNLFMNSAIRTIPDLDMSKSTTIANLCNNMPNLEEVGELKTPLATNATQMFSSCPLLKKVKGVDFRNVVSAMYIFSFCKSLTDCYINNIKVNLQVGNGTSWGHLLTAESLIHLIYQLRDAGSARILTIGSANLEKLADVYVRIVDITDEMRNEDDLIDEKLPFEVCESTDEDAVLIVDYAILKNWDIQ